MRGKPKGIQRSLAKKRPSIPEKMEVSRFGAIAGFDEFAFIQLIKDVERLHMFKLPRNSVLFQSLDMIIATRIKRAVRDLDSRFFERCREVIDRLGESTPADPMGLKILDALNSLAKLHLAGTRISSTQLVKELEARYPREDGQVYIEKDVREVAKDLGLKFPVSADEILHTTREYIRMRFGIDAGGN